MKQAGGYKASFETSSIELSQVISVIGLIIQ